MDFNNKHLDIYTQGKRTFREFLENNPFCWQSEYANDLGERFLLVATCGEENKTVIFDIEEENGVFLERKEVDLGGDGNTFTLAFATRVNGVDWLYETATENHSDIEDIEQWFNELDESEQTTYKAEAYKEIENNTMVFIRNNQDFFDWLEEKGF